jgi:hypothetical protein
MHIEVKEVNEFGHGYCVVHQDDGTSFGQHFSHLPVEDAAAFDAALDGLVIDAIARNTPIPPKILAAGVVARIGVKMERPAKP